MITERIKLRLKGSSSGGAFLVRSDNSAKYNHRDVWELVRDETKDLLIPANDREHLILLNVIRTIELDKKNHVTIDRTRKGDNQLLNRVFIAGGFIKYIKQLEEMNANRS